MATTKFLEDNILTYLLILGLSSQDVADHVSPFFSVLCWPRKPPVVIHLGCSLPESCHVCGALSAFASGAFDLTTCDKFFKGVVPCHMSEKFHLSCPDVVKEAFVSTNSSNDFFVGYFGSPRYF